MNLIRFALAIGIGWAGLRLIPVAALVVRRHTRNHRDVPVLTFAAVLACIAAVCWVMP